MLSLESGMSRASMHWGSLAPAGPAAAAAAAAAWG